MKVLSELFKKDNFLIKHTERAKKMLAYKTGIINVKKLIQRIQTEQNLAKENQNNM